MKGDDHLPEHEIRRRALSGFKWAIVGKVVMTAYSWVITLFMVRYLDPADYGLQAMWEGPMELSMLLGIWCLDQALIRQRIRDSETLAQLFGLLLVTNTIAAGAIYFGAPYVASYFKAERLELILQILAIPILLTPFRVIPNALLDMEMKFKLKAQVEITASVVSASTGFICALMGVGVWALVTFMVLEPILRIILMAIRMPWYIRPVFSINAIKPTVKVGTQILLGGIVVLIGSKAVQTIAGPTAGPEILGYYVFAATFAFLPMVKLMPVLNQVMFTTYANLKEIVDVKRYYLHILEVALILICPICFGMVIAADYLIKVAFGEKWLPATLALMVMGTQVPIRLMHNLAVTVFNARGNINAINNLSLCVTITSVLMSMLMMGNGLAGLLMIGASATLVYLVGVSYLLHRYLHIKIMELLAAYRIAIVLTSLMTMGCIAARVHLSNSIDDQFLRFVGLVCCGATIYLFAGLLLYKNRLRQIKYLLTPSKQ